MWKTSSLAVMWTLWKERNSRCFKGVSSSEEAVSSSKEALAFKVEFLVASWVFVLPIFRGYSIDDITRCWKEAAFSCPFIPQAMPPWTPSLLGTLVLNFDGSAPGNPGQLGIGVFLEIVQELSFSFGYPLVSDR